MNVLDENILESQRLLLRSWGVPVRQIGNDLGRKGMQDEEILPFLLTLARPTLFSRDLRLFVRANLHARYCVATMAVGQYEVAHSVRRVLRHPEFDTQAKRMGTVVRVAQTGVTVLRLHDEAIVRLPWSDC